MRKSPPLHLDKCYRFLFLQKLSPIIDNYTPELYKNNFLLLTNKIYYDILTLYDKSCDGKMTGKMLTESSRLMRGAKLNPPIYLPELRPEKPKCPVGVGVLQTLKCF